MKSGNVPAGGKKKERVMEQGRFKYQRSFLLAVTARAQRTHARFLFLLSSVKACSPSGLQTDVSYSPGGHFMSWRPWGLALPFTECAQFTPSGLALSA